MKGILFSLLLMFIYLGRLGAQVDTTCIYLQSIEFKNEVNNTLVRKDHKKNDTSRMIFVNRIFLTPCENGILANDVSSKNFFDKVILSKPKPNERRKLKPEYLIHTLIINKDSLKNNVSFNSKDLYYGAYGNYFEEWTVGEIFVREQIKFLIKNKLNLVFTVGNSFAFRDIVVKNGQLYFLEGFLEYRLIPFDDYLKEKPYILDRDTAEFYKIKYDPIPK